MIGLINSILEGLDIHLIALDSSTGKRPGQVDMARALAAISCLGYSINLQAWDCDFVAAPEKPASKSRVEVTLTGTNFVREKPELPAFTIRRDAAPAAGMTFEQHVPGGLTTSHAFTAIQENLTGLQRLQEQTAVLHQQVSGQST